MQTREQLVTRALENLDAVPAGQGASGEDYNFVDARLPSVMDDLARRRIYTWGDPDAIGDAECEHIAIILANSVAPRFGRPQDETARLYAEARLRELTFAEDAGDPIRALYY